MTSSQRGFVVCLLAAIAAGGWLLAAGEDVRDDKNLSALMLAKTSSTHRVVDGLVSEDFAEIARGARELSRICVATEWSGHDDQVYSHHRTELQRLSAKLEDMAKERNLDGAAYTYMHSLTVCISCHQHCRDVLRISDEVPAADKIVPIPVTEEEPRRLPDRALRR
ncbi:MAG: hypothetical protein KF777_06160 [Planctomycetaceae bacterium]|nr:hypothetical protein [Planctomycetaceae bacterium]